MFAGKIEKEYKMMLTKKQFDTIKKHYYLIKQILK